MLTQEEITFLFRLMREDVSTGNKQERAVRSEPQPRTGFELQPARPIKGGSGSFSKSTYPHIGSL